MSASSRPISADAHLDDGDLAAEAAEHLAELEPDVAAADDHQVFRQRRPDPSSSCWSGTASVSRPGSCGTAARPPTLMKMRSAARTRARRRRPRAATGSARGRDRRWQRSSSVSIFSRPVRERPEIASLRALTRAMSTLTLPAIGDAEVGGAAGEVRGIGAGDHRLGRNAAGVDAGAADEVPLDDRDRHARRRQGAWRVTVRPGRCR